MHNFTTYCQNVFNLRAYWIVLIPFETFYLRSQDIIHLLVTFLKKALFKGVLCYNQFVATIIYAMSFFGFAVTRAQQGVHLDAHE